MSAPVAEVDLPTLNAAVTSRGLILTGTPDAWAHWVDLLTRDGFKALMLIQEPVREDFHATDNWPVRLLVERGMGVREATLGSEELDAKGLLRRSPVRWSDLPDTDTGVAARPSASSAACRVCGTDTLGGSTELTTYAVQRGKYLRIGATSDLPRRLAVLREESQDNSTPADFNPSSRMLLVGTTSEPEHTVHEALAPYHVIGEWFDASPTLKRALRELLGVVPPTMRRGRDNPPRAAVS